MGYVTIAAKIVELVDEITALDQVFNYEPDTLGVYPCATVTAVGHQSALPDIAARHVPSSSSSSASTTAWIENQDAETILRDLTDQVIAKLETNVVVAGVWDIARPTEAVFRTGEREVPVQVAEITARFEKRVNRNV